MVDRPTAHPNAPNLTDREVPVFALSGAGFGTSRIAKELGISLRTVETYFERIKLKLGYSNSDALHQGAREIRENPYSSVGDQEHEIWGTVPR